MRKPNKSKELCRGCTIYNGENFSLTRFWGGSVKGVRVQITTKDGSVQLTAEDAHALAIELLRFRNNPMSTPSPRDQVSPSANLER